ncbi:MAG TPA: hypothetical protein VF808_19015 [Ktedonobacterales bacterium]
MTRKPARRARENNLPGLLGRRGLGAVGVICLLALAGCASETAAGGTAVGGTAASGTPWGKGAPSIQHALPHFSDWRMAYLAPDGHAHVVTLDGKTDLAGPVLPGLTTYPSTGLIVTSAGIGADGKTLAYAASTLEVVDLTAETPPNSPQVQGAFINLMWAPSSSKLYSGLGGGQFFYVTMATGQATTVTPEATIGSEVGWIDDTHVAAVGYTSPTADSLESLDITNDRARAIATVRASEPTTFQFVISPDRSQALVYDTQFRDQAFTPRVALIDLGTGRVTPLPAIAGATDAGFSQVAWRPGTKTIAVTSGYAGSGVLHNWLLDVAADTATSIALGGNVMSWAPDNGPLILSSGYQSQVGGGPYILKAAVCDSAGRCSTTTLTRNAMTFDFVGFLRNP